MSLDFSEYFQRYESVIAEADAVFGKIREQAGERVRCHEGCSDCCYALFDLTLIEALYLNHQFNRKFSGLARTRVLERADAADRTIHKFKHRMFKASQEGMTTTDILREAAATKVRCPLLNDGDLCDLYEHRPVTCRIYGVPTAIGGQAHTCHRSGFEPGGKYPTVLLDKLQDKLYAMSLELAASLNTRYSELGSVIVPVSMALMNAYDEEYLGITAAGPEPAAEPVAQFARTAACGPCDKDASACASCKEKSFSIVLGGPDNDEAKGK